MSLKRGLIGAIIPVAIFAIAYTYFNTTITNQILSLVDLQSILNGLPVTISVNTVILAIVGIVAGLIGGFFAGKNSLLPAIILTIIFSVLVVAGNLIYGAFAITSVQDVLSLDPTLVLQYLQNNIVNSLTSFAGGIVGMIIGLLIGTRFTGGEEE